MTCGDYKQALQRSALQHGWPSYFMYTGATRGKRLVVKEMRSGSRSGRADETALDETAGLAGERRVAHRAPRSVGRPGGEITRSS